MRKVLLWAMFMVVTGCTDIPIDNSVRNVVRIFMIEPGKKYAVWVQEPGQTEIKERVYSHSNDFTNVKVFLDVPKGQKPWIRFHGVNKATEPNEITIEFHLPSAESIEGGGWNHGKFGRGTTQVIH